MWKVASGLPEHRLGGQIGRLDARQIERRDWKHYARILRLKLVASLAVFLLLAQIYESQVNYGAWTERPPSPKASHKGAKR